MIRIVGAFSRTFEPLQNRNIAENKLHLLLEICMEGQKRNICLSYKK